MKQMTPEKQIVLDNEFATLWYYPQLKIVHHKFHKFIFGDNFRMTLSKGAEFFEKEKCSKWLSDDRGNSALPAEDSEWATKVWSPRMVKAGWKNWALIMPDKAIGKMNMKRLVAAYDDSGVKVEIFDDEISALEWLVFPYS